MNHCEEVRRRSLDLSPLALQAAADTPNHSRLKLPSGRIAGLALLVPFSQDAVLQQACQEGSGKTLTSTFACSVMVNAVVEPVHGPAEWQGCGSIWMSICEHEESS